MLQPFRSSDEENNDSQIREPLLFGWITNQPIESKEVKEMSLKRGESNSKINSCERRYKNRSREGTLKYNIKKITAKTNNYQIEELV